MLQNHYGRLAIIAVFVIIAIILLMAPGMNSPKENDQLNFTNIPKENTAKESEKTAPNTGSVVPSQASAPVEEKETMSSPEDQMLNAWGMRQTQSEPEPQQIQEVPAEAPQPAPDVSSVVADIPSPAELQQQQIQQAKPEEVKSEEKPAEVKTEKSKAEFQQSIKVGQKCFTMPKISPAMEKTECDRSKVALGIQSCPVDGEKDAWAGAVKSCGNVSKLPTMDDLFALAGLIYPNGYFQIPDKIKSRYRAYGEYSTENLPSDNISHSSLTFGAQSAKNFGLPENAGFSIWGRTEISPQYALALTFNSDSLKYTSDTPRNSENFYTICEVPCP